MRAHHPAPPNQPIILSGQRLTLDDAVAIANGAAVQIDQAARKHIDESRHLVDLAVKGSEPIYGVNTGFGYFANEVIAPSQLAKLQENLLRSHAAGHGSALTIPETRLAMALRLNVLIKGFGGVRYALCEALLALIDAEIYPIIPEYGSVGASGDLAPLAHLALPLIGEGEVIYQDKRISAQQALKKAKIEPFKLKAKEALALVNGTQIMLAVGGLALARARPLLNKADRLAALTMEGLVGHPECLYGPIHEARGQRGQIESARNMLYSLEGSYLFNADVEHRTIQDSYSLRCAPQIHGPSREAIQHSLGVIEIELNAATDNPLVFTEEGHILSGGNFHGQPLALAFDFATIALSEIANVSDRRLELLLNPHMSGLAAFLSPDEGLQSGYMALQYLTASIVNECKLLANPACTDSIPGNVGVEDHVSMGMTSARKLKKIVDHVEVVLASEWLAAAQAIDMRGVGPLGKGTNLLYEVLREQVPPLNKDRIVANDVDRAVEALRIVK